VFDLLIAATAQAHDERLYTAKRQTSSDSKSSSKSCPSEAGSHRGKHLRPDNIFEMLPRILVVW